MIFDGVLHFYTSCNNKLLKKKNYFFSFCQVIRMKVTYRFFIISTKTKISHFFCGFFRNSDPSSKILYLRKNSSDKGCPGPRGTFECTIRFDLVVNFQGQMEVRPFS